MNWSYIRMLRWSAVWTDLDDQDEPFRLMAHNVETYHPGWMAAMDEAMSIARTACEWANLSPQEFEEIAWWADPVRHVDDTRARRLILAKWRYFEE